MVDILQSPWFIWISYFKFFNLEPVNLFTETMLGTKIEIILEFHVGVIKILPVSNIQIWIFEEFSSRQMSKILSLYRNG